MSNSLNERIIKELEASAELHTFVLTLYEQDKVADRPASKDAKQHLLGSYRQHASACRTLIGQLKQQ
jgi:hypothetical protein